MSDLTSAMNALINNNPDAVVIAIGIARNTAEGDIEAMETAATKKVKSWGMKNPADEAGKIDTIVKLARWFQIQPPE